MNIRSKALYNYLLQQNVLTGTPEAIVCAKQQYRKLYKKRWKQQSRPQKEIRFVVTLKQFHDIKTKAMAVNMKHSTFAKMTTLAGVGQLLLHDDTLLEVLQLVSMATIATARVMPYNSIYTHLQKAETMLLQYLNMQ